MDDQERQFFDGPEPVAKLLYHAARDWRTFINERMKPMGMSDARWMVLFAAHMLGEPSPQRRVADLMDIAGPTLVKMLDKLEADGLVRRVPDSKDRRVKLVEMLPAGRTLLHEMFKVGQAAEAEVLSVFSEQEIESLRDMLIRARQRMAELLVPAAVGR